MKACESEKNVEAQMQADLLRPKRVIIRVWTSSSNLVKPGKGMGHVSIQTSNNYISLWPAIPATYADKGKLFGPKFHPDPLSDYEMEKGTKADYIFCFYTLDSECIDQAFICERASLKAWMLPSSLILTPGTKSCASLVWELLEKGNISHLVSTAHRSLIGLGGSALGSSAVTSNLFSSSSHAISSQHEKLGHDFREIEKSFVFTLEMTFGVAIESPDSIAAALLVAKQQELQKYPETQLIKRFPSETKVAQERGYCLVM